MMCFKNRQIFYNNISIGNDTMLKVVKEKTYNKKPRGIVFRSKDKTIWTYVNNNLTMK